MESALQIAILVGVAVVVLLQVALLRRRHEVDLGPLLASLKAVEASFERTDRAVHAEFSDNRQETAAELHRSREELAASLREFRDTFSSSLERSVRDQHERLTSFSGQISAFTEVTEKRLEAQRLTIDDRVREIREVLEKSGKSLREETGASLKGLNDTVVQVMTGLAENQRQQLLGFSAELTKLTASSEKKAEDLKLAVAGQLKSIQEDNTKQLEQMRATVDEKLQGTLEKRLGESFKLVSDRLEQVYKGLGEMQTLAIGVGDLKKVLTNVKSRGTWGEVMLGRLLEDVLLPDQYAANVATSGTGERVEYAVKLPGRSDDPSEAVWLPIDSKFPIESYERLRTAQDAGDLAQVEAAAKQLENAVRLFARTIAEKYVSPPKTTDFAILFLPTEGLYAEVVRNTVLIDELQRTRRVMVAGPTTLLALLSSLQMGFRTLAIEKRSSEVWQLLSAVKTEWGKYGESLALVQKKLEGVTQSIAKAEGRVRAVGRKLRGVGEIEAGQATAVLGLDDDAELISDREEGA